jgi:protein TonB
MNAVNQTATAIPFETWISEESPSPALPRFSFEQASGLSRRRPLSARLGILAGVILMQVGVITAICMHRISVPLPKPAPLFVIDIPSEQVTPKQVTPPPPVAPTIVMPIIQLPEIAAAPDAITLPPPKPVPVQAARGSGDNSGAIVQAYQTTLLRHLARYKRYPAKARLHHKEGVALVRFTMDRSGDVLSVALGRSSGVPALDEESVELVRRAAPLPTPPMEVRGNPVELMIPVEFTLN